MKKIITRSIALSFFIIPVLFNSCKKFLDAKPNDNLAVPASLADFQSLIDNNTVMNRAYGEMAEHVADNYYLDDNDWAQIDIDEQDNYVWGKDATYNDWLLSYRVVLYANTVLDNIGKVKPEASQMVAWNNIKGSALFFRAFAFFNIAQEYCPPYAPSTSGTDPGIPLRLTAGIDVASVRATVQQTYDQIIGDLKQATGLLPQTVPVKTRPTVAAAYGALARTYLSMALYDSALVYANKCLQIDRDLIDFNSLDSTSSSPFVIYNQEVIFHSTCNISNALYYGKIDSVLYASFSPNDLRKSCFFLDNGDGTYAFKGSFSGSRGGGYSVFNGITTDETFLIRAECFARAGDIGNAMNDLNNLLITRWRSGTFTPLVAANADEALGMILTERRKELIYRSQRWTDLRRLNMDSRFAITLTRHIAGETYTLPPNDPRYTLLIPADVIKQTGMAQNPR